MRYAIVKLLDEDSINLSDLIGRYLNHLAKVKSPKSIQCVDRPALRDFFRMFGDREVGVITREDAERFFDSMRIRLASSSVRIRTVAVRLMFKWAIANRLVDDNIFSDIKIPPARFAGRVLSNDEIAAFLSQMDDRPRRACLMALYTGMRRGEICSLDWSQIEDNRLIIPVEKSKSKRERTILLQPKALEILGPRGSGSVFFIGENALDRAVSMAWRAAGIGRFRFHDLRHTAATRFMDASDDVFAMMAAFGWKDAASAKPYQHMTKIRQERMFGIRYDI